MAAMMRAVQVSRAGGNLELVERPIPTPGRMEARIRVLACGICHSDVITKEGLFPGIEYPRVPGHEVIGLIDALGADVPDRWTEGQRVGIGWHAWHCLYCDPCRRGDFFACAKGPKVTGIAFDGGYADYLIAPVTALALVPEGLTSATDAAPLLCAGLTTFNPNRNSSARPGDLVAILGIGGLGHLGVQYAAKMGFRTVAIARGKDKEELARKLGATHYIDSQASDPSAELQKLGGATAVIATVTHGPAMSATIGGLAPHGKLMVLGADQSMEASPLALLLMRRSIEGWYSGTSIDSQDTLNFSLQAGVKSMNEVYPLERAAEGYDRMLSGKARFRVVLKMD